MLLSVSYSKSSFCGEWYWEVAEGYAQLIPAPACPLCFQLHCIGVFLEKQTLFHEDHILAVLPRGCPVQ